LSCLFQSARSFSGLRIAHNDSVRRTWRFALDASECECFRIGPVGMPVVTFEKSWSVREQLVEIFLVRQGFGTKHRIVPAAAEDPVVAGMLRRVFAQFLLDVRNIFRALQIHAAQAERNFQLMNVTFCKTRKHALLSG